LVIVLAMAICALGAARGVWAQTGTAAGPKITTPKEFLGFNIGDDYHVANYTQLEAYWKKLATESERMKLVDIGLTAEGRHQWMAIISSPANLKQLDHYKEISKRLALAEGVTEEQARAMAREGKAVVWIDGGLHASESVGSQQEMEMVYQMLSRTDAETMRLLNDDIILCVLANPDGQELIADWYMRNEDPAKRSFANLPLLYHHYIGHDDNRDSYMSNMPETINMNRQLFIEWFPQIMYNHHQSGPAGAVIFMPPFRDPFNYHFDPLVPLGIEAVGTAMHSRLVAQGKGGSAMRSGSSYSTWWNGGLRTTVYFHNMIGILTEIIGSPTPMKIPFVLDKQLPQSDWPMPIPPSTGTQEWHYRQSIDYEIENNRAILDYASRNRETLLFNIWQMGMNSIKHGNEDSWTVTPKRLEAVRLEAEKEAAANPQAGRGGRGGAVQGGGDAPGGGPQVQSAPADLYNSVLHDPKLRDPRGYIIPSDQADFATATKFINTLLKNGITVLKAASAFEVAGKKYPAGSYVVKCAQAARPFVLDMFEPQDHPNDFRYPGGPPIPPYDIAGWTVAFQMGVQFDRVLEGFDGPFAKLNGVQAMPAAAVTGPASPAGYLISHRNNNSFILTNRLLKGGAEVYWLKAAQTADGEDLGTGAIWVPASAVALPILQQGAKELGVPVHGAASAPMGAMMKLQKIRIGLYDQYGGLMPSGWTRWIFEQFEFPFELVYPQTLDAGDLKSKFDVLVFTDGAYRAPGGAGGRGGGGFGGGAPDPQSIPEKYRSHLGRVTPATTIPQLKKFLDAGGSIVTIGSSTSMAALLGVPVKSYLMEKTPDGKEQALPREKFYIPGSLMRVTIDTNDPLAYGMPEKADVMFDSSPVFQIVPDAKMKPASVAWYAGPETLDSGWAWGQAYLDGGTAIAEASVGAGKVIVLGPEVAFRAQPHGTFKFLFNGVYLGSATGGR
jgi:hypothetical protein